jgi:DNA-binding transcriptional ArsR family regulator
VASVDLLVHPVRLRILQTFLGDRSLTTSDLIAELADIPAASLYRHVARLVEAGVLAIVAERRVRGSVERTYELRLQSAVVGPEELAAMSVDDHRQAFMTFVAGLLGDFDRYLARGDIDLVRDGVSYSMAAAWLDDAEYAEMMREIVAVLQPRYENPPGPARKRRILASVLLPADELPADETASS